MSREIKFRAWDKNTNDWYLDKKQGLVIDLYGGIANCWNGELMDDYTDRITLLQYTGLKDKNGVEIYEGDIVTYVSVYKWNKKLQKSVVTFSNGMFNPGSVIGWGKDGTREVIGNIYENPKLLEASE